MTYDVQWSWAPNYKNCMYTVTPEFYMTNEEPSGVIEMVIQPGESK